MLNRLMFCYFIQKKGFLNKDSHYLRNKLAECKTKRGTDKYYSFYRDFLLALFHDGLGAPGHSSALKSDIGTIPYLNGGLFDTHQLERDYDEIEIKDEAFEKIFDFFDQYEWHLDTRVSASGRDVNPDVIGYIFEKYINDRAQMGAYYTKEDITEYISKNCILPFLFDETKRKYPKAFESNSEIWEMLKSSGDSYIYDAVKYGVSNPLPAEIEIGLDITKPNLLERRKAWNKSAPETHALPTEIWREVVERRNRYADARAKIENGEIENINDFITYNLNIRQFVQDAIENTNDPEYLKVFYLALNNVTIIDPTCGSGAFLFAAMNILEPLYEACLLRMRNFVEDEDRRNLSDKKTFGHKFKYFREVLEDVQNPAHPNLQYFIYKSIILRNLYGVDIMKEAVEIAKLRLFLKLVATVDADYRKPNLGIEPLPDIDFNIRAGNTLIGFATEKEIDQAFSGRFDFDNDARRLKEQCEAVAMAFDRYKAIQLSDGNDFDDFKTAKDDLTGRLNDLNQELNGLLHKQTTSLDYHKWLASHQPFHWYAEFYEIIHNNCGFDVIIGNPPYLELRQLKSYSLVGFRTTSTRNLFPIVLERCISLLNHNGKQGFIVPVSSISTDGYSELQRIISPKLSGVLSFDDRPSHLFDGLDKNTLSILLLSNGNPNTFSTRLNRWFAEERSSLFDRLCFGGAVANLVEWSLPKIGSPIGQQIWGKLLGSNCVLALSYSKNSHACAFYSRKINSFLQVLNFVPEVRNKFNELRPPSEFKALEFQNKSQADIAFCGLNSSLFRWFLDVLSDGSHLNKRDVDIFPLSPTKMADLNVKFSNLANTLSSSLKENSEYRTMNYVHDSLNIQCIIPKKSKPIIDEIDKVLAEHYGFTEEELDFIINYDIKYRMGRELENVGDTDQ